MRMVGTDIVSLKIRKSTYTIYVLSLFFATTTTIVLIAKLLTKKVSKANQSADNYNSHDKLFHLYLLEMSPTEGHQVFLIIILLHFDQYLAC